VNGGRLGLGRPTRQARLACAPRRSPLTAIIVALSLVAQLIALPYHQSQAAPQSASLDTAAIAAELKATFGYSAALCGHVDDKGAPMAPHRRCDDQCQLCRFSAQAAALIAPDAPTPPVRLEADPRTLVGALDFGSVPPCPTECHRARAPPLAV
jgi:hypothetical protein